MRYIKYGLAFLFGFLLVSVILHACMPKHLPSTPGQRVYVDRQTGCHYVGTYMGTVAPRLDNNGDQICE